MPKILIYLAVLALIFTGCSDNADSSSEFDIQDDAGVSDDVDDDADNSADADNGDDGCTTNADCDDGEFCEAGCDEPGSCEPITTECGEAETPYCDCDGQSQVAPTTCVNEPFEHLGECEDDEQPVECETSQDCTKDGTYCEREPGCDELGTCEPIDDDVVCDEAETPYCGCDGEIHTSPNSCIWDAQDDMEACETNDDPDPDGCLRNDDCDELAGEYCEREPGCDDPGTCEPIPQEQCLDVITDYCDCDGQSQQSPNSCIYEPIMNEGPCLM